MPGVFEIPVTIAKNINRYDWFIALGWVIKGKTPQFDFIYKSTTDSITQRAIDNTYRMRIAPYEAFPSTTNGYGTSVTTNASVSAAPSDTTAEDLEPGIYFSGLGACPHVSIKVSWVIICQNQNQTK